MQKALIIKGTQNSPHIIFDRENEIFEISGRSLLEDTEEFYSPATEWIQEYVKNPNENTEFIFRMDYLNSSSAKRLMDILYELELILDVDKEIKVIWYYEETDDLAEEQGEDFASITDLPFEMYSF